jgi:hypothetical protein
MKPNITKHMCTNKRYSSPLKQVREDESRSQEGKGFEIGASGSSEEKSVGLDANYRKGSFSANAAANVGAFGQSVTGGVNYDTNKFSAGINASKSTGGKPGVSARAAFRF